MNMDFTKIIIVFTFIIIVIEINVVENFNAAGKSNFKNLMLVRIYQN